MPHSDESTQYIICDTVGRADPLFEYIGKVLKVNSGLSLSATPLKKIVRKMDFIILYKLYIECSIRWANAHWVYTLKINNLLLFADNIIIIYKVLFCYSYMAAVEMS